MKEEKRRFYSRGRRGKKQFKNIKTAPKNNKDQPKSFHHNQKNTPADPNKLRLSPTPPTLSPISTPKLLSRSHSVTRDSTLPASSPIETKKRLQSACTEVQRAFNAFHFSEDIIEPQNLDRIVKKSLKLLMSLKTVDVRDVTILYLFRNAPKVTTFSWQPN